MFNKYLFLLLFSNCLFVLSQAQLPFEKDFCHPLDIELELAGTFGEFRSNHLHSGLDLKTQNKEGYNVYAAGKGYVSRIKIAANGYGNALYITHQNGFTTVYGHLQSFNKTIQAYSRRKQYDKKSFEIDLALSREELPVEKGDIIALSGNSGGAESPHLHFEVRDTRTEEIINPLSLGLQIKDSIAPAFEQLLLYPFYQGSVNESPLPYTCKLNKAKDVYTVKESIYAQGLVGFGVSAIDMGVRNENRNGFYTLDFYVNNKLLLAEKYDRFAFDETRYVNGLVDFKKRVMGSGNIALSHLPLMTKIPVVKVYAGKGLIEVLPDKVYNCLIICKDFSGNTSSLKFVLKGRPAMVKPLIQASPTRVFLPQTENVFNHTYIQMHIPQGALLDTLPFEYSRSETPAKMSFSHVHHVHNIYTPLLSSYSLSIKALGLPQSLESKALIAIVDSNKVSAQGGQFKEGWVSCKTKSFGDFIIVVDTIPPLIKPLFKKIESSTQEIKIKVTDELSGIRSYQLTVDGEWELLEYDAKTSTFTHQLPAGLKPGKHLAEFIFTDQKNNISQYRVEFFR